MPGSRTSALGTTRVLARFAADMRYEDLPSEAVATLKQLFLDTVATSLAGTTLGAGCAEVVKVVRASAGTPESTLIGFGVKAPALTAAFANGATAHVSLRDGQQVSETVRTPLGHPDRPLTFDQIVAKLRDCAPYAAAPLSTEAVDQLIEGVERLEDIEDVAELSALVMGRHPGAPSPASPARPAG